MLFHATFDGDAAVAARAAGEAEPVDAANLEWTVNASVTGMSVVKTVSPARVAIEVLPDGTIILFR